MLEMSLMLTRWNLETRDNTEEDAVTIARALVKVLNE